jgi:hypothetical protein
MNFPKPGLGINTSLIERAQMIALANRQKLLNREADDRTVKEAVRQAVSEIKSTKP